MNVPSIKFSLSQLFYTNIHLTIIKCYLVILKMLIQIDIEEAGPQEKVGLIETGSLMQPQDPSVAVTITIANIS